MKDQIFAPRDIENRERELAARRKLEKEKEKIIIEIITTYLDVGDFVLLITGYELKYSSTFKGFGVESGILTTYCGKGGDYLMYAKFSDYQKGLLLSEGQIDQLVRRLKEEKLTTKKAKI